MAPHGTTSADTQRKLKPSQNVDMFNRKSEPTAPASQPVSPPVVSEQPNRTLTPARPSGLLSRGVSIKGSVKFPNELLIDGEVEGTINSPGKLSIEEHAQHRCAI